MKSLKNKILLSLIVIVATIVCFGMIFTNFSNVFAEGNVDYSDYTSSDEFIIDNSLK